MKLSDLAAQIVKAAPEGMLTEQMLYASLDFRGNRNAHLAIPEWHDDPDFTNWEMRRHEFLTGREEVRGDVLVFDYGSHDGRMVLQDVATLAEAGAIVLGGAGILNAWTDLVLVFERGRLRPYRVSYRNASDARVVLDRSNWDPIKDEPFPDRRVEWLETAA